MSDLNEILDELHSHKRSKKELLSHYINERLNLSLKSYYKDISYSAKLLKAKNPKLMAQMLNKENAK